MRLLPFLVSANAILTLVAAHKGQCEKAAANISIANTTLLAISHHKQGDVIRLPGTAESCGGSPTTNTTITADLCRLALSTNSSDCSAVHIEAWLPDDWNGRLVATGGSGLGGCIEYGTIQNAAVLGFASFGTNSGHNGSEGHELFLNKPEVIADFGHRAAHIEAKVAKELTRQYYSEPSKFNYYVSCSTGGRQGLSSAIYYPEDFDGMIVGAPAVEWARLMAQLVLKPRLYGWPNVNSSEYVTLQQFEAVAEKTRKIFDPLDGVRDGMIDNPTHLRLDPEMFACGNGVLNESVCLRNPEQVESVRRAYEPMVDSTGKFVFPSLQLGADPMTFAANVIKGQPEFTFNWVKDYYRGVVYNDSSWDQGTLSIEDIEYAAKLNAGLTNTPISEANMTRFKKRGGKIISYHGRYDPIIPSELSEWWFNGARANMNISLTEMQDFYRLFFIPGLDHCALGPGAWNIGQWPPLDQRRDDSKHNVIRALTDWVEHGKPPQEMIGSKYKDDDITKPVISQRKHCVYPKQSVWDGDGDPANASSWKCQSLGEY